MKEVFIKKYWPEENINFYIHFQDQRAVRQIEITSDGRLLLSETNPVEKESKLYDQNLNDLSLEDHNLITQEEFEKEWNYENYR